jgi:glycosyltransferase involved in cell wall biosynthesis
MTIGKSDTSKTVAIILTLNEELHITRAVKSAYSLAEQVYVIDAMSTDRTKSIAEALGATVLQNPWTTHAAQFNWALEQLPSDTDWVVRLDADEFVDDALIKDFHLKRNGLNNGLTFNREIHFCGTRIRFGGLFPVPVVRAFRFRKGSCEQRLMDEHIIVDGSIERVDGLLIDQNLNPLDWWIDKHNRYASLEAVEILNLKHQFFSRTINDNKVKLVISSRIKRWIKNSLYLRLPIRFRARIYYIYRAYLRLGILGNREERTFHFLQGFWYRYLVDVKVAEVERYMHIHSCQVQKAIFCVLRLSVEDLD